MRWGEIYTATITYRLEVSMDHVARMEVPQTFGDIG
jgi:hypothetical protein